MPFVSRTLRSFLSKWPGRRKFGFYSFLPIFFVLGAALEFSMIKWQVGETNFYKVYKRRQAKTIVEEKLALDNPNLKL
ncbi:small integral membrane protein 4 [Ctenocephalides felis]|uniref:small integral membrane protein 4 n=1 Tax=Ctenocephalides felis TaxID=7515 RepID=UPI000E6E53BE|nr:small integral membrane protein 4 [Ctenocephalides felis]